MFVFVKSQNIGSNQRPCVSDVSVGGAAEFDGFLWLGPQGRFYIFPLALFARQAEAGTRALALILAAEAPWQHRTALYSGLF